MLCNRHSRLLPKSIFVPGFVFIDRTISAHQTMDNFPSTSTRKPSEERKEETILCNVCVEKNEKDKKQADMYCYICDTVYCDNHAGVSNLNNIWFTQTKSPL